MAPRTRPAGRRGPPTGPISDPTANAAAPNTPQMFGGDAPEEGGEGAGEWSDERLQEVIAAEMAVAVNYYESELAPRRTEATRFYEGEGFEDDEEGSGRSQVVSMDLRDTVLSILPSLVRVFLGGERWGEFAPQGPDDEDGAKQRTEYMQIVAHRDNPGFRIFHDWFKEILTREYGPMKWWWDDGVRIESEQYEGLSHLQVLAFTEDDSITEMDYEEDGEMPEDPSQLQADPVTGGPQPNKTYTVRIKRKITKGRARYGTIPGEEFFVTPGARTVETANIVSHTRPVTRSELRAMGIPKEILEEHDGSGFEFRMKEEFMARESDAASLASSEANPDMFVTEYGEHYLRFDEDGDGIAELHKVCTLGADYFVVQRELAPEIPFTIGCADPEPHLLIGGGLYGILKDLQRIKSAVLRAILDSLRGSIDPRIAAMEEFVNMDDLLNHEVGGVIRTQRPPAEVLQAFDVTFSGQAGLLVMEYLDSVKEQRTGMSKGSQGLDAGSMQSTTVMGIAAQLSAAQQRIDMIARILAETCVKDLFLGLQRLLMRHQDIPRMVKLRGKWVEVDPRTWDAELDLDINVGLGMGLPAERMATVQGIVTQQKEILATMGPTPLVGFEHLSHSLRQMAEIAGYPNATAYFGEVPAGWQPPPPTTPSPEMLLAKAQADEIQAKLKMEEMRVQQDRDEMLLKAQTERMKIEADIQLEILKIEAQYQIDIDETKVTALVEHARVASEESARRYEAEKDVEARRHEADTAAQAAPAQE